MEPKMKPMEYVWTFIGFQLVFLVSLYLPVTFFLWDINLVFLRLVVVIGFLVWLWFLGWVHFEKDK